MSSLRAEWSQPSQYPLYIAQSLQTITGVHLNMCCMYGGGGAWKVSSCLFSCLPGIILDSDVGGRVPGDGWHSGCWSRGVHICLTWKAFWISHTHLHTCLIPRYFCFQPSLSCWAFSRTSAVVAAAVLQLLPRPSNFTYPMFALQGTSLALGSE